MTQRQEMFCLSYIQHGNATKAYLEAGYKPKKAHTAESAAARMLRNVEVMGRIRQLTEQIARDEIANSEEIQILLTSIIRGETKEIITLRNGQRIEIAPRMITRIRAIDTLAKIQGLYLDNRQDKANFGQVIVIHDNVTV